MLSLSEIFHSFNFWSFLAIIAAPLIISSIDFIVLTRTRFIRKTLVDPSVPPAADFTILIPIFGHIRYLKNVDFLKQYSSHVFLCTTDRESPEFNRDIERVSAQYGFQIFRSGLTQSTRVSRPNPWRLFKNTLVPGSSVTELLPDSIRDEIIKNSFSVVTSKYCIFIDGDTFVKDSLDQLVGMMNKLEYDLASVRVVASQKNTLMEKLQSIEYELAMDARKIYPWLTSGAGMVAKTEVIKDIMSHHSLFFSGGDIEIGKLARLLGYKVGHLPFEFFTDVPSTFSAWFRQRIAWCGGGFRHAIINWHSFSWKHPFFFLYTTIIVYLLTPIRWLELLHTPEILPFIVVLYWILITIFHFRTWKPYYLLFPFYSLVQVMIIVPLGAFSYISMVRRSRNIGLIKLRFPHPFLAFSLRRIQFRHILLLFGATLLMLFFTTQFLTSLLFLLNISVTPYHFPFSLVVTLVLSCLLARQLVPTKWIWFSLANSLLIFASITMALHFSNKYFDISYDGNAYHQSAVIKLASGWNPIYRYVSREEVSGLDRWVNHYSKGAWYTESNIAKFLGTIEPAKAVHFLLVLAAFSLSLYTLLHLPHLPPPFAVLISLLLAGNPVSIYQSLSFYVDGQLSSLIICLISLLTLVFFFHRRYLYFLLAACIAVLINVKLTAFLYAVILLGGGFIYFLIYEKLEHLENLVITSFIAFFIGVFVIGFNPYITNTLTRGHPFYPAAGKGALDFRTPNLPENYFRLNSAEILFLSAFSRAGQARGKGEYAQLKFPLSVNDTELQAFRFTNPIEGGWGPLFGFSLLVSAFCVLSIFAFAKHHGFLFITISLTLIILVSCIANPSASLARFTPQFWLLPVFISAISLMHRHILIRLLGTFLVFILIWNVYLISSVYYPYQKQVTQEWAEKFTRLSRSAFLLPINPGEFRLSLENKFIRYRIPYYLVSQTDNCRRMFTNSIALACPITARVAGTTANY